MDHGSHFSKNEVQRCRGPYKQDFGLQGLILAKADGDDGGVGRTAQSPQRTNACHRQGVGSLNVLVCIQRRGQRGAVDCLGVISGWHPPPSPPGSTLSVVRSLHVD